MAVNRRAMDDQIQGALRTIDRRRATAKRLREGGSDPENPLAE